ncbi:vWA domain-containing protein [Acetobacterium tundrae]|uniref:VWA domain-containing protein n=1 Tax=Acetobacterium tundrae TaxID=132932 RepID=A0ABR6WG22_9FIRM|nr:VWA domain-containing protein [Acetobacterium tundrae]MBC3795458.1 VWA domain-containing protein [Acetobacterium tundrae]
MGIYDELCGGIARRTMVLFFLVDTSGSMAGSKIGAVNEAINDIVPELRDISDNNADAQIKIAVLEFNSGAEWLYPNPIEAENFEWDYLDVGGVTDLGTAFTMLDEKLSRNEFMSDVAGSFAPAIFLMSDGQPTDHYEKGLAKLKENNWYKNAIKVAVAIGDDADQDVLKDFTGNSESVLTARNPEALKKMITFVSVTASKIGSQSSSVGFSGKSSAPSKQDNFVEQIQDFNADIFDDDAEIEW